MSTPATMRAWVQRRYGTPVELELAEIDVPTPGQGEVLVRVAASSVNAADRYTADPPLALRPMMGLRRPKEPVGGLDVAGTVVAVGAGVPRLAPGDAVFGEIGGGWAEYAVGPASSLGRAPSASAMSLVEAGGVPVAGLTALQGLRDHAGLGEGERVLVNGASGGVGTYAVQIAVALGAEVTAVCSTAKLETARSIGAREAIDYTQADVIDLLTRRGERFDVLFDVAGVHSARRRSRLLAPGGRCVFVGAPSGGRVLGPLRSLLPSLVGGWFARGRFVMFVAKGSGDDMETLASMIDEGRVRTVVDEVVPFERLPDALTRFRSGHTGGKILVDHGLGTRCP